MSEEPPGGVLRYEVNDHVATITLDRPAALNALDAALKHELLVALETAGADRAVRVIVVTGAGRAFCAGQDLREVSAPDAAALDTIVRVSYNPVILAMRRIEKPVIAAVNGVAAGAGASLAFAADLRIASEAASFVLGFSRVGLAPDSGSSWFLPRLIGLTRAAELLLVGDPVPAAEAERLGLVNRVVPADGLLAEAVSLAGRLADAPPRALALAKRALNHSLEVGLEEALEHEAELQGVAGSTADYREALAAFLEKRPPEFTGE